MRQQLAFMLVGILLFVAAFGLPILLSHTDHHFGCPLQTAQMALCSQAALEHLSLWQSMFASTISVLVLFFGIAVLCRAELPVFTAEYARIRTYRSVFVERPLQELFSRGILNRKEDHHF